MKTKIKVRKLAEKTPLQVRVEVRHIDAKQIFLAGTFNSWQPETISLKAQDDGWWATDLSLPAGAYEYRFIVDGKWTSDPHSPQYVRNSFGSFNSVMFVKEASF